MYRGRFVFESESLPYQNELMHFSDFFKKVFLDKGTFISLKIRRGIPDEIFVKNITYNIYNYIVSAI